MSNRKIYRETPIPGWTQDASRERLLEHIQFLTHQSRKFEGAYNRKVRQFKKYRDNVDEIKEEIVEQSNLYAPDSQELYDDILVLFKVLEPKEEAKNEQKV